MCQEVPRCIPQFISLRHPRTYHHFMPQFFAPDDPSIPDRLRARFESWADRPPKTQFQQYGPLNAYFSIKFPPSNFLVKPQALLRELWDTTGIDPADIDALRDFVSGAEDHTMEIDDDFRELGRRASIDSQGALVDNERRHYPDFVVTTYATLGLSSEHEDTIRLVVEVGSLGRDRNLPSDHDRQKVIEQLQRYLHVLGRVGYRCADTVVGMCIIGTEVAILKSNSGGKFAKKKVKWESLYSENFRNVIRDLAHM